ncbi:MAG: uracil-DNA glycosylase [Pirellulaceae bacterium]
MPTDDASLARARRILTQRLESLSRAGVQQLGKLPPPVEGARPSRAGLADAGQAGSLPHAQPAPISPPIRKEPDMPRAKAAPVVPAAGSLIHQPYPPKLNGKEVRTAAMEAMNSGEVKGCKLCRELAAYRTQTVFGVGDVTPRVVMFGEAPGADEDKKGEPFVGRAGQLLNKIIEACTWKREDVYILNTLKCRPPDNRPPDPAELANCRPFWERQLEILQPEYIVCLGTHAAQSLLETDTPIGRLRSKFFAYRGSKAIATYHPSYLLRSPDAKKLVWDDMQMLLKDMGVELPKKA